MHIEQLEIDSFGGLQQVRLENLGQGIEVIHGTNEIGKTSLLEFIRAVFFGFEGLFRRGVLDPKVPCERCNVWSFMAAFDEEALAFSFASRSFPCNNG